MRGRRYVTVIVGLGLLLLAGCSQAANAPTAAPSANIEALPTVAPASARTTYCEKGGAVTAQPGEPLAARVNGQAIPLALFERQAQQAQAVLQAQGVDPTSEVGKEALQGLREQILAQLIDDALVEQAAHAENIQIADQEIDNRVQQMIDEAGGRAKFDEYLAKNQLTLPDLCAQIRSHLFAEAMIERITRNLPTRVEQVHVAHILFATREDAAKALTALRAGADFAAVAKQSSQDEATRHNGGDLGWIPREVMPPEFEQAAFALQPGQISEVVATSLGFHIIKVLERDAARVLTPELLQNQRQAAFLNWLEQQRRKAKIERWVTP